MPTPAIAVISPPHFLKIVSTPRAACRYLAGRRARTAKSSALARWPRALAVLRAAPPGGARLAPCVEADLGFSHGSRAPMDCPVVAHPQRARLGRWRPFGGGCRES